MSDYNQLILQLHFDVLVVGALTGVERVVISVTVSVCLFMCLLMEASFAN